MIKNGIFKAKNYDINEAFRSKMKGFENPKNQYKTSLKRVISVKIFDQNDKSSKYLYYSILRGFYFQVGFQTELKLLLASNWTNQF